jgi:hypothetical protein
MADGKKLAEKPELDARLDARGVQRQKASKRPDDDKTGPIAVINAITCLKTGRHLSNSPPAMS